jgi:hypothetical protein
MPSDSCRPMTDPARVREYRLSRAVVFRRLSTTATASSAAARSARPAVFPLGTHAIRGKAWSGTGPISSVEVSSTGEGEWHTARLQPPTAPTAGRRGRSTGNPPASADTPSGPEHRRRRQRTTRRAPWNRLGYGDNAIEVMYVDVRQHHRGGGSEREMVARPLLPSGAEVVRAELVRVQPALLACASDRATRS